MVDNPPLLELSVVPDEETHMANDVVGATAPSPAEQLHNAQAAHEAASTVLGLAHDQLSEAQRLLAECDNAIATAAKSADPSVVTLKIKHKQLCIDVLSKRRILLRAEISERSTAEILYGLQAAAFGPDIAKAQNRYLKARDEYESLIGLQHATHNRADQAKSEMRHILKFALPELEHELNEAIKSA